MYVPPRKELATDLKRFPPTKKKEEKHLDTQTGSKKKTRRHTHIFPQKRREIKGGKKKTWDYFFCYCKHLVKVSQPKKDKEKKETVNISYNLYTKQQFPVNIF